MAAIDRPLAVSVHEIWDVVPDGLVLADESGVIRDANASALAMFGYERDELLGQPVEILVPDALRVSHIGFRSGFAQHSRRREMGAGLRLHGRRQDGSVFPVNIGLSPLVIDGRPVVVASVRDITAWLRAEEALSEADQRRAMAEDHERIARDLHDTVIQELFAVGMALQAVHAEAAGRVQERIGRAVDSLDETIRQIRVTIFGLRSGALAAGGLLGELESVLESLHSSLGFLPSLEVVGPIESVPALVAPHLAPVTREALSNVVRHAAATSVLVRLVIDNESVTLEVIDDGVGMSADPASSSGLVNLARRAEDLGGALHMRPGEGSGTRLRWTVPLRL
jgi:PAS domain S-box-containing protein